MAKEFKNFAIRQLSFHNEPSLSLQQHRRTLRKQFSVDVADVNEGEIKNDSYTNALNKPPLAKLAWEENLEERGKSFTSENVLVTKKVAEADRAPLPLTQKSFLEKGTVPYSRRQIAQRLRSEWEKEQVEKFNLNIFLNTSNNENTEGFVDEGQTRNPPYFTEHSTQETDRLDSLETDNSLKDIFQKHCKRATKSGAEMDSDNLRKAEHRPNALVVVPIIIPNDQTADSKIHRANDSLKERRQALDSQRQDISKSTIQVDIRPATATTKREMFRHKRIHSAFSGSVTTKSRPPLTRVPSLPIKSDNFKQKFVPTKRRLKSAKRRDVNMQENKLTEVDHDPKTGSSSSASEIVTMVSLISPGASDTEEQPTVDEQTSDKAKVKHNLHNSKENSAEWLRKPHLRKIGKSVSFQQSSIHTVRCFSASFPARNNAAAATTMIKNAKIQNHQHDNRETIGESSAENRNLKNRRLLRTNSAPQAYKILQETENIGLNEIANCTALETAEHSRGDGAEDSESSEIPQKESDETRNRATHNDDDSKGKQCWNLYKKISENGITVSYDTILRGMLTPTEYRMHRMHTIASDRDF